MGERGRELYGLGMSPHNSQLVACGDVVVIAAVHNAAVASGVADIVGGVTVDDVVVVVGDATAVVVWVRRCWRDKGSQGIHGQHNSMQGRSVLRVTPTPPFIAFLGTFRVFAILTPSTLTSAPFRVSGSFKGF